MTKKLYIALASAAMLSSCHPGRVYNEVYSLSPDMVWDMNNILDFDVEVADSSQLYDIKVDLRTVDYYPTNNMWLFVKTMSPSGSQRIDTMECILRDDKGFSTSGNMSFGELEDYEFTFAEAVKFHEQGVFKIQLQHGMRIEQLPFVNEVGLSVYKHE